MLKKSHIFLASAAAVTVTAAALPAEAASAPFFTDVKEGNTLYPEIKDLHSQGKINGFKDGTFRPQESVTRGQAAKMIADILELDTASPKAPGLKDVKKEKWYYGAVAALVEAKIMGGFKDGTFRPDQTLTRAEASRLIGEAFNLSNGGKTVSFTDVKKEKWYYTYIQALVHNNVTAGKTATTFAPDANVTRGELVAFASRAKKAIAPAEQVKTIESVQNGKIMIDGKTYTASESVKGLLQSNNSKALKGAEIEFEQANGVINTVSSLVLKEAGTESAPLVLDGSGAEIKGNVTVAGDNVELKNMTINGNLTVTAAVKTSFSTNKLTVKGTTSIQEEAVTKAASVTKAAAEDPKTRIKITFKDSSVAVIEIAKKDVYFSASGSTTVTALSLYANADIFADEDVIIPKVDIKQGVTQIELNATIQDVVIDSNDDIQVSGKGNFSNVVVNTDKKVTLATTGAIKNLDMKNENATLNVGSNARITNISVPAGQDVSKIVDNYNEVKDKIETVGGEKNPDYTPPAPVNPPGSGGGTEPVITPPSDGGNTGTPGSGNETGDYFAAGILKAGNDYGYVKLNLHNEGTGKVFYQQVSNTDTQFVLPEEGDTVPSDAIEYKKDEKFINWFNHNLVVYRIDASNKITDVVDVAEQWYWSPYNLIFNDNETVTVQMALKADGRSVEEFMDYVYVYQEDAQQKTTEFTGLSWETKDGLPAITLSLKDLKADAPSMLLIASKGMLSSSFMNDGYDNDAIKIRALYDLIQDQNTKLDGHEFSHILGYIAYERVTEEIPGGGTSTSNESLLEQDSLSMKTYKERLIAEKANLQTAEAIKAMVVAVNEELKAKVDTFKTANEKVSALYKEDRYSYSYEEQLREGVTLAQMEEALAAVEALSDEFQEKSRLKEDVVHAQDIFSIKQVNDYISALNITVPANLEAGSDLTAYLSAEGKPADLTLFPIKTGQTFTEDDNFLDVQEDSSYLRADNNELTLIRPNKTGETITEYVLVNVKLGSGYLDSKVIPVTIQSSDRDEAALSSNTGIDISSGERRIDHIHDDYKFVTVYRGTSVEQLKKNVRSTDLSAQTYTVKDAEGQVKASGRIEEGDTLTVTAENGKDFVDYTIHTALYLAGMQEQELGSLTFNADETSVKELQETLYISSEDASERNSVTVTKLEEESNKYKVTFEGAELDKPYRLLSDQRLALDTGDGVVWRSYSLAYTSESRPRHSLLLKEESDKVDITSKDEIDITFSLFGQLPAEEITVDGVTIRPVLAEQADGSYKVDFVSEGTDEGKVGYQIYYMTVTVDGVENSQVRVGVQENGEFDVQIQR
ncbi:S-layer homology domain-containing protein [Domibacillus robiginosus]|uniref:S-layer homology domain-containing protein n=1 Tax=Domibacillus robiginosus TaxID=1071054 RepID=UPI00067DD627|nr:S-layer homology domain-containing protein [Domibacillus robiginosus]